ncbi:MAG: periplasmic nitrate reductase, NapE protein [Granulosicoccaceae bacterium]
MPTETTTDSLKREELQSFLFLTALLAPILSIAIVGGYGFMVWIFQIFGGPPTG